LLERSADRTLTRAELEHEACVVVATEHELGERRVATAPIDGENS